MTEALRYTIDPWAPDYGAALAVAALEPSKAAVDENVEVPAGRWAPIAANLPPATTVRFLDGVRRVDARVWITEGGTQTSSAIAASWAAGVVCCDGAARIERCEVRRGLFGAAGELAPLITRHGRYEVCRADDSTDAALAAALQSRMGDLEDLVAQQVGKADLIVVDGPLRSRPALDGTVGFVKTHQRAYLPAPLSTVVERLAAGERTPLFLTSGRWSRFSWYLRLPGAVSHAWAGVVRCEVTGDLPVSRAASIADLACATLPRFASATHKDARAPQNLYPIAGLERRLRHHLGDPGILERALRMAAR